MGTGQTLLVLGAVVLLSTVALTINRALLTGDQVSVQTNLGLAASSVCRSLLEDRARVPFASLTPGTTVSSVTTPVGAFPCTVKVAYVQASTPDIDAATPTPYMKISVSVPSPYLDYTVRMHTIVGNY